LSAAAPQDKTHDEVFARFHSNVLARTVADFAQLKMRVHSHVDRVCLLRYLGIRERRACRAERKEALGGLDNSWLMEPKHCVSRTHEQAVLPTKPARAPSTHLVKPTRTRLALQPHNTQRKYPPTHAHRSLLCAMEMQHHRGRVGVLPRCDSQA
jgi:hypothetical protein